MQYYVLKSKYMGVSIMERPYIPDDLEFDYGIKKNLDIPIIEYVMDKESQGDIYDQISTTLPGLTISNKFKQAFSSAGVDNIDYYRARIKNNVTGEVHDNIYVANVIGLIECMDKDESEYDTYPGMLEKIQDIESLVLHTKAIKGYKVFRMKEFDSIIIVDESVKKSIEDFKITNTILIPVEEFDTY